MICRLLLHEIRENGKNNSQSHGVSLGEIRYNKLRKLKKA